MSDHRDAGRQLALLARAEVLSKVAREQMGMDLSPGLIAQAAGGMPQPGPGVFARLTGAVRYLVTGVTGQTWMGPNQPLPAFSDQPEQGVVGRRLDYPVGYNVRIEPRSGELSFATLRGLAESYDLLRLALETCKDQIESFAWEIVPEDEKADRDALKGEIARVSAILERPNGEMDWSQWLRALTEDLLVLDGVAVYPQYSRGGQFYGFDLIDPSTIKRVIDEYGRTPMPPDPAYQQVLKGVPAVDYTRDQLAYIVRNPRTWKLYGYGPVEQVIMTVNIAMRRQVSQLQYYTEGNIPEALISAPDAWTAQQVQDFQQWWDSDTAGNTGQRRRMHFVPNFKDGKVVMTKGEEHLKDEYDEWLAKIICYALSIPAIALMKQMNRASSEQLTDQAKEEGQMPRMRFIAAQVNRLLKQYAGAKGVVFKWQLDKEIDPLKKAQATKVYLDGRVITPDEVRQDDLGKAPLSPEEREAAWPAPVQPGLNPDGTPIEGDAGSAQAGEATPPGSKAKPKPAAQGGAANGLGKSLQGLLLGKAKAAPVVTAVARAVARKERSVTLAISRQFRHHGAALAASAATAYAAAGYPDKVLVAKAESEEDFVLRVLNELQVEDLSADVVDSLTREIKAMYRSAGITAVAQVGVKADRSIVQHLDEKAAAYVERRGGELVKGLSATTRERLRTTLTEGVREGWSADRLRKEVEDGAAFDEDRAQVIARTELAKSHVEGNVEGWRETGEVEGKRSILGDLHEVPDECDDCVDAGTVDLDDDFVDGFDFPPYHPNCVCDVLPVLRESE